jgi:multicomponent Na+:H+ antiporter subunit A
MEITEAVLSGFGLSLAAPWLQRVGRGMAGWIIALLPLGLVIYFASFLNAIAAGQVLRTSYPWIPSLEVNLSFYADGLGLLFALLISGIGALVVIYAGGYLAGHPQLGRFYAYLLVFMASMLGVVLADNLIVLFVFWELTSLSSYLLIGFYHTEAESRASALQALLVTGAGGLALLAGFVLLGLAGGSWELSTLLNRAEIIQAHPFYLPGLVLILLGAFTKSAQFPFHFWLPAAMAAPAPVSAYLHSATMVKAGVYLLARLNPALGGTDIWQASVTGVGVTTMLVGAYLAWLQTDLKRILAYSTISALGMLVMLIGWGSDLAIKAMVVFLVVHSFYKGALFLVAGAIDHETGTRDITRLGGLRQLMPISAVAAGLAALSMAGIPPWLGFISKELIYEATLNTPVILAMVVAANVLSIVVAGLVAVKPFFAQTEAPSRPHEAPPSMWLGPLILAGLGLVFGLAAAMVGERLMAPAVSAIAGRPSAVKLVLLDKLSLWSEDQLNVVLLLSVVTVLGGIWAYTGRETLRRLTQPLNTLGKWGPARWYDWALDGMMAVARRQTRLLQSGYLRFYLLIVIITTIGLVGTSLLGQINSVVWTGQPPVQFHQWVIMALILIATVVAAQAQSRLAAVAALGVVGYGVALIFILFGAPDLAMTQFAIETLTVILFVLVLYRLPRFAILTSTPARLRDIVVASMAGGLMTALILVVTSTPTTSRLTPYFAENSLSLANGRNIVNVILVDFRALDTLGEITVLAVAAIGIYALMKLRLEKPKLEQGEDIRVSLILSTATRYLLPLLLLFSVFLLIRGHNEPGGGFVGGLVAAAAFALYAIAYGVATARQILPIAPGRLIGLGLLLAVGSGILALVAGQPFLTGLWHPQPVPVLGKIGTPLLFDVGVYLTVIGVVLLIIFSLMED